MLIYASIFAAFAVGSLMSQRSRSFGHLGPGYYLALFITLMVVGLRWQIGPDWQAYTYVYDAAAKMDFVGAVRSHDPGFFVIAWLLATNDQPFWALNLVMAGIFLFGLIRFARTLPNPWLAITVATPYLIIVVGMNLVRQAAAMGFVFLALRHLGTKPLWRSIGWALIGSLFHASAIIVALLIGISHTKNRLVSVLVVAVSAIPMYYILFSTFDEYFQRYGDRTIDSGGVYFRLAINAVPALMLLALRGHQLVPPKEYAFWRNMAIISLLLIPLPFFVHSTTPIDRISMYAIPLQIVVLSAYPYVISKPGHYLLNTAGVMLYSAVTLFAYFAFGTHARYFLPYHWVFGA